MVAGTSLRVVISRLMDMAEAKGKGSEAGNIRRVVRREHVAVEDDGLGAAQVRHRRERRVLRENEAAELPRLDAAELLAITEPAGAGAGGGVDHGERRQACPLHQLELVI